MGRIGVARLGNRETGQRISIEQRPAIVVHSRRPLHHGLEELDILMDGRRADRTAIDLAAAPSRRVSSHALRRELDDRRVGAEPVDQVLGVPLAPSPVVFGFQRAVARVRILREIARDEDAQRERPRVDPLPGVPEPHQLGRFARRALAVSVPQADLPVLFLFRIPDGHLQVAAGRALIDPDAVPTSGTYGSRPAFTGGHKALLSLVLGGGWRVRVRPRLEYAAGRA
jgi:hypothetical protein